MLTRVRLRASTLGRSWCEWRGAGRDHMGEVEVDGAHRGRDGGVIGGLAEREPGSESACLALAARGY